MSTAMARSPQRRRSGRTQQRMEDNREAMLAAAQRLVATGGFRAAQMAAIASEAGFATGTLYRYFPSRAGLFREVLARVSQREVDVVAEIASSAEAPPIRLRKAVGAFAGRAMQGRQLAHALIAEPVDEEIDHERLKYRKALSEEFERILEAGVISGDFVVSDTRWSAAAIAGATMEALVGPLAPSAGITDPDRLVEALVDFCLRAVLHPSTPPSVGS